MLDFFGTGGLKINGFIFWGVGIANVAGRSSLFLRGTPKEASILLLESSFCFLARSVCSMFPKSCLLNGSKSLINNIQIDWISLIIDTANRRISDSSSLKLMISKHNE